MSNRTTMKALVVTLKFASYRMLEKNILDFYIASKVGEIFAIDIIN